MTNFSHEESEAWRVSHLPEILQLEKARDKFQTQILQFVKF